MKVNNKFMKQSKRLYNMRKVNQEYINEIIRQWDEMDDATLRQRAEAAHDRYLKSLEDKTKQVITAPIDDFLTRWGPEDDERLRQQEYNALVRLGIIEKETK